MDNPGADLGEAVSTKETVMTRFDFDVISDAPALQSRKAEMAPADKQMPSKPAERPADPDAVKLRDNAA